MASLCDRAPVAKLRAVTNLLQAHADRSHIVVAPPSVCRIWEECDRLSEEQRGVAKKIRARYSELSALKSILPIYAKVIAAEGSPSLIDGVWSIPFPWIANYDLSMAHLICEDMYDCNLGVEAARDYLFSKNLSRLNLSIEKVPGGGGNTSRLLFDKAIERQRISLCVVDSDRDEPSPSAVIGETAKKCLEVAGAGLYEVCITPGRELENHIPIRLVDQVRALWQGKRPSQTYVDFAVISDSIPLFADYKAGMKQKTVELMGGDSKEHWSTLLPSLKPAGEECCTPVCTATCVGDCRQSLVHPFGRTLLRDVTEYLNEKVHLPNRSREYLPSPNDTFWLYLGGLVAAFGVSTRVTPSI